MPRQLGLFENGLYHSWRHDYGKVPHVLIVCHTKLDPSAVSKMQLFEFLTDECVSDHNERITLGLYYLFLTVLLMMKLYIRNVWVIMFLSICINLILSL